MGLEPREGTSRGRSLATRNVFSSNVGRRTIGIEIGIGKTVTVNGRSEKRRTTRTPP